MLETIDKDVMISIMGIQHYEGEDEQSLELITGGKLSRRDGSWYITYPESEMTGMEGTVTTFEVAADGAVTLRRSGTVGAEMRFQEGRKFESLYNIGKDTMLIGVKANRVKTDLSEEGGRLEVDYAIEIEHNWAGKSRYDVKVRELGANITEQ